MHIKYKIMLVFIFFQLNFILNFKLQARENKISLPELIKLAQNNSLEIEKTREHLKVLKYKKNSLYGHYLPKLSLESVLQETQYENQKEFSNAFFGKIDWNLYAGGIDSNSIDKTNIEINFYEQKIIHQNNRIKNHVSQIYIEILYLKTVESLYKQAIEDNNKQKQIANSQKRSGLITETDTLEFILRSSILDSDLILLQQQLKQKIQELTFIVFQTNQNHIDFKFNQLSRIATSMNREELVAKLQKFNQITSESRLQETLVEFEKRDIKASFHPKVNLETIYGQLPVDRDQNQTKNNYELSLKITIPLFSGFSDYNLTRSLFYQQKTLINDSQSEIFQSFETLDKLINEINYLNSRIDLEEKNIELTKKYLRLTKQEYLRGTKSSSDIISSAERALNAQVKYFEIIRDLIITDLKIKDLIGD